MKTILISIQLIRCAICTFGVCFAILCSSLSSAEPDFTVPTEWSAAANQISEAQLRGHIRFLADDLLEGRGPGTTSDAITQLYVATELERLGYQPFAGDKQWIQPVPMVGVRSYSPQEIEFKTTKSSIKFRYFDDFIGNVGNAQPEVDIKNAEVIFVGYGIEAPEYGWNDYKSVDLKGKVLLMMNNDPEQDPQLFGGKKRLYYGRWSYKYESAARQGALGAIIIHTTPSAGYPYKVVQTSWTGEEFELKDKVGPKLSLKSWMTEEAAKQLVENAGLNLDELRAKAEKRDFQPVALNTRLTLKIKADIKDKDTGNVIGLLPGSDPSLIDQYVLLMAHHDHLGLAETRDEKGDNIYNGAIDNASGTATVLTLARAISSLKVPPKRSVIIAVVGAEEQGLLGSAYFSEKPPVSSKKIAAVINVDGMNFLGRTKDVHLIGSGKSSLDSFIEKVAKYQSRVVTPDAFPERGSYYRSDQFSLAKIGVPGVYLQSGTIVRDKPEGWGKDQIAEWIEKHYHQRSDQYDPNWNLEGAVEDTQLLFYVSMLVSDGKEMPKWNPGDEFERLRE